MILLARHGRTAYNAEGRFQGQGAVPLDATGRAQANELAEVVAARGIAGLWSSPLARALQTAEVVAARLGLELHEDARFAETDAGDWTDRSFADVQASDPDAFARFVEGDAGFAFPGGESFVQQAARVAAGLQAVRATGVSPALVVCHGITIRIAMTDMGRERLLAAPIGNAAVVELP